MLVTKYKLNIFAYPAKSLCAQNVKIIILINALAIKEVRVLKVCSKCRLKAHLITAISMIAQLVLITKVLLKKLKAQIHQTVS
jgi:hypothetical protein